MRFTIPRGNQINIAQIIILQSVFTNKIKCWFLMRGENRSTRGKTSHSRVENQQTQSTYDTGCGNQTQNDEKIYALEFFLFVILIIRYLFIQVSYSLEYLKLLVQWKLIEAPMGVSLHKYSVMQHSLPMT